MPFVRNLKKLGININLRQVDAPQYLERTRRYDFDMTTMNLPQSLNPGNEQAQFWEVQQQFKMATITTLVFVIR